ncbi:hypothetical protein C8J57DRAFT_1521257 [Mycena rebaudengoi]|nr:hypothetical protein C8J57DRAFT_1521257 [Mycena rebaudengoi]
MVFSRSSTRLSQLAPTFSRHTTRLLCPSWRGDDSARWYARKAAACWQWRLRLPDAGVDAGMQAAKKTRKGSEPPERIAKTRGVLPAPPPRSAYRVLRAAGDSLGESASHDSAPRTPQAPPHTSVGTSSCAVPTLNDSHGSNVRRAATAGAVPVSRDHLHISGSHSHSRIPAGPATASSRPPHTYPHSPRPRPGTAAAVRACPWLLELKYRVSGVAVLDVVEGSAIEVLPDMLNFLNAPRRGRLPEFAIEWHCREDQDDPQRDLRAHSVPAPPGAPLSTPTYQCKSFVFFFFWVPLLSTPYLSLVSLLLFAPVLVLVLHSFCCCPFPLPYSSPHPLRLASPAPSILLTALSAAFLAARIAGMDRLDRPLMITQMQGSFIWRSSVAWAYAA